MKTSLLLVAHGSRRESSNDEVREVADTMAAQGGEGYHQIRAAFLELAEPLIPDGILACLDDGADRVVVVPYFLSAGRHVVTDIPNEVDKARAQRPDADIVISPYLGSSPVMTRVLLDLAAQTSIKTAHSPG